MRPPQKARAEVTVEGLNWPDRDTSVNLRAEELMGRRPSGVAFDLPCELGYWCPVCRVPPRKGEHFDERLHWSEYNGFLWCEVCNRDYPSALCVRMKGRPDSRDWVKIGPEAAIEVYLNTVRDAVSRALKAAVASPASREATLASRAPRTDRTVHAEMGDEKIVRYGRAGKWFIEFDPPRMRSVRQVAFREAVGRAREMSAGGGAVHLGRPGGGAFDRAVVKSI